MFKANDKRVFEVGGRANEIVVNSSKNNKSKNLIYMSNIRAMEKATFLISNTKKALNHLKQAFIKAKILQYFD